MKQCILFQA